MLINQRIKPNLKFWTEEQVNQLHLASLQILEKTGVIVHDKEAIELLHKNGAKVEANRVFIPGEMVEDAIKSAPEEIELANTDGERFLSLRDDNVYYGLGTDLPKFVDPYSSEVHQTVLNDVINVGKVTQQAENIDFVASLGLASDVPQNIVDLYHFKALHTYCKKPQLTTASDVGNMKALIDMAAVLSGGYNELKKNSTIVLYAEPISPLVNSKEALQKLLLCAEYEIPVTYASGIMAGATGPATLSGSIAVGNAEGLAGLVMHQLKKEGAPFIYGLVFSVLDMKTTVSRYGGPELALGHAVASQLGKYYNLPTYGTGGCTDTNTLDAQAGMESLYSNLLASLSGTNLVHDNGYLGSGLIGSLEMILLDDEIISFINRFNKGVEIDEEKISLDLIHEVGPGGNFLTSEHTFKHYRKETWYSKSFNREQFTEKITTETLNKKLNQRVRDIIEKEIPPVLTNNQLEQLDEIIIARKEELARN